MREQMNTSSSMTSECRESRLEWTRPALGETTASFGPPAAKQSRRVTIPLLDAVADPRVRARSGHGRRPRHSLTSGASDHPAGAANGRRKLSSHARQNLELEVGFEMSNADFWRGYRVRPQPCVVVRNRAWKRRAQVTTKLARHSGLGRMIFRSLEGVVYGPDGAPLADALVRLPGVHRSTRTGQYGEFKFGSVPRFGVRELIVEACGRELVIDVLSVPWPLAIHFQFEE
jgi:hypothetical protein